MNDQYYIQYHNADLHRRYPFGIEDFSKSVESINLDNSINYKPWVYTKKRAIKKAIGQSCFLVVGKSEQKIKKYFLWAYFKIEDIDIDTEKYYSVYGTGYDLAKPIILNELENFPDFKKFCGNFGFGFQNIDKHPFCKTLISLLHEAKLNSLKPTENYQEEDYENESPTIEQYQDTIATKLSKQQIEILQVLYHFSNSSTTAIQLEEALNHKSSHGVNRQIGVLGEEFYKHTSIAQPVFIDRKNEHFAYFYFIGEYKKNVWTMRDELKKALENLNLVEEGVSKTPYTDRLPTEIMPFDEKKLYEEGKATEIFVNRYERNQKAKLECKKHYGTTCHGCGFDFEKVYGSIVKGFIEVHHIVGLANIGKRYTVDPVTDLIPLCSNCHSVIHMTKPALTIEELKKLIKKNSI